MNKVIGRLLGGFDGVGVLLGRTPKIVKKCAFRLGGLFFRLNGVFAAAFCLMPSWGVCQGLAGQSANPFVGWLNATGRAVPCKAVEFHRVPHCGRMVV